MLQTGRYWLGQGARVGWFLAQYVASARLTGPLTTRPRRRSAPGLPALLADLFGLLRRDAANIRAGVYRLPHDGVPDIAAWVGGALRYFADLPAVNARRRRRGTDELPAAAVSAGLPGYYRRAFHFQTDGYLSAASARLYDQQVDVLFLGSADAMRRQALVPVAAYLRRRPAADVVLADIACGTGRFLTFVRDSFPRLRTIGLDLSRPYLAEAERQLRPWPATLLLQGQAEALPFATGSIDLLTCVYLLHEVPRPVRRAIAREAARALRPGGRLIIVDSLQFGDHPPYDGLLESFPEAFHEPYYADYAADDLDQAMAAGGLRPIGRDRAFLSKVLTYAPV